MYESIHINFIEELILILVKHSKARGKRRILVELKNSSNLSILK